MKPIPTRLAYGQTLVKLGREFDNIIVMDADLSNSTQTSLFAKEFPDRFINVGIAEQNLMGVASGLALSGKVVFASSFAIFATGRTWEQIRNSIAYMNLNVKIAATHSGLSVGPDGASHQALEDLALMRVIPNMVVLSPADVYQTEKAIYAAYRYNGPVYIRLGRAPYPIVTTPDMDFEIGKDIILKEGRDGTIFATGLTVGEALKAAEVLEEKGFNPRVVNIASIKPLDKELILKCAKETGFFITVEEHQRIGGMGSAIAEFIVEIYPIPIKIMGIDDSFGETGTPDFLLKKYRIDSESIVEEYLSFIKKIKVGE